MYLMAPVIANNQQLTDVQEKWSLDDLADWHEAADLKKEAEAFYFERARQNAARK